MDFFTAAYHAKQLGIHIRRAVWLEDVETPLSGSSNKRVTAWVAYWRGAWIYRPTGSNDRVVTVNDVDGDDLRANDWTVMDAEGNGQIPPAPGQGTTPPPVPPILPLGSITDGGGGNGGSGGGGGSAGGSGSGGGSAAGVTDRSLQGGGSGGGGGSTQGGSTQGGRPRAAGPRPDRTPPVVTINAIPQTEGCISLPADSAITDEFLVTIALGTDGDARPGEIWMYTLWAGGLPPGRKDNGTLVPGESKSITIPVTALPGMHPTIKVDVYLANVGLHNSATTTALMRPVCGTGIAPEISSGSIPAGYPAHPGDAFTIVIEASGTAPLHWAWYLDGDPLFLEGPGASLATNAPPTAGLHYYTVTVWNAFGSDGMSFEINTTSP